VPKELQVTTISLQTNNGSEISISILIVPKIAAPLQILVPIPGNHYPHLLYMAYHSLTQVITLR